MESQTDVERTSLGALWSRLLQGIPRRKKNTVFLTSLLLCHVLLWNGSAVSAQSNLISSIDENALSEATTLLQEAAYSGDVAGVSHIVWLDGEIVHFHAAGVRDLDDDLAFTRDTVVRINTMSGPITAVAALTLFDQGKFALDDPIQKYLPGLRVSGVLDSTLEPRSGRIVPAEDLITVRDLLRRTSGWSYPIGWKDPLLAFYRETELQFSGPLGENPPAFPLRDLVPKLGRIPLCDPPGTRFTTGPENDLLGLLIEIWSGQPLDAYVEKAICRPLGMRNTGFTVRPEINGLLSSLHSFGDDGLQVGVKAPQSRFHQRVPYLSGDSGMVSTIDDYLRFCVMLATGGGNILKHQTVDKMMANQLKGIRSPFSFGLGLMICPVTIKSWSGTRRCAEYSWIGGNGCRFRIVPEINLIQIILMQQTCDINGLERKASAAIYKGLRIQNSLGED
ncbi:MAG: serine hydrolase domain-containing protein [Planctomycetota bacterium]